MKKQTANLIHGLEASRRVGWAKYHELQTKKDEERERLRDENAKLRWTIRLLIKRIIFHARLGNEDDLVVLAKTLESAV